MFIRTCCSLPGLLLVIACIHASAAEPSSSEEIIFAARTMEMIKQLQVGDWILRAEALDFLAKHKAAEAAAPARKIAGDTAANAWIRGRAIVALARIEGAGAIRDVLGFAKDQDVSLRRAAADAMEYSYTKEAESALQQLLKDKDIQVRYNAMIALARHNGEKAWPVVDSMTKELPATEALAQTAQALAYTGTPTALARLAEICRKSTGSHQKVDMVIQGLGRVHNPKLIPMLLETSVILNPGNMEFHDLLAVLRQYDRPTVNAEITKKLGSSDERVIMGAAWLASRFNPSPEIGDAIRKASEKVKNNDTLKVCMTALAARSMNPDRHKDLFTQQLKNNDASIRLLSVRCLAQCDKNDFFTLMGPCMSDENSGVVTTALTALLSAPVDNAPRGKMVAYLKAPLEGKEESVRSLALQLLARAGSEADYKPAMALLEPWLRGKDEKKRAIAANALNKIVPEDDIGHVAGIQGFLVKWMVIGTFIGERNNGGLNKSYPPDREIDFSKIYKTKYLWGKDHESRRRRTGDMIRDAKWKEASVDSVDGKLWIAPLVPPPAREVIAYAVADFEVPSEKDAILSIDGDDAFRLFFNEKKISEKVGRYQHRHASVAEDRELKIKLRAGRNRIMVKTTNIEHDWWFRVRLSDPEGNPIEVKQ